MSLWLICILVPWHRNFIFGMIVHHTKYLGQVWISWSLGQGYFTKMSHFEGWAPNSFAATTNIWYKCGHQGQCHLRVKVISRSRSFWGKGLLRLNGALVYRYTRLLHCNDFRAKTQGNPPNVRNAPAHRPVNVKKTFVRTFWQDVSCFMSSISKCSEINARVFYWTIFWITKKPSGLWRSWWSFINSTCNV